MIDLHIHSTNSDGYYTVQEILKMAEEKNIKMQKGTPSKNMKCKMHLVGVPKNIKTFQNFEEEKSY